MPDTKKPKTSAPSSPAEAVQSSKGGPGPSKVPLSAAHESLLAEFKTKYDVLPVLILSSNKISKRVDYLLQHLGKDNGDPRPRVALLHARPAEVCKMISIAEHAKRELGRASGSEDKTWYQYNMMYELPPKPTEPDVVEETVLGGAKTESKRGSGNGDDDIEEEEEEEEEDDDCFEMMESRFQKAIIPQPASRVDMSLSTFLARVPVPELKGKPGVSVQVGGDQTNT